MLLSSTWLGIVIKEQIIEGCGMRLSYKPLERMRQNPSSAEWHRINKIVNSMVNRCGVFMNDVNSIGRQRELHLTIGYYYRINGDPKKEYLDDTNTLITRKTRNGKLWTTVLKAILAKLIESQSHPTSIVITISGWGRGFEEDISYSQDIIFKLFNHKGSRVVNWDKMFVTESKIMEDSE